MTDSTVPEVAFSPQISIEQVALVAQKGFKTVINNRPDNEEPNQPTSAQIQEACEQKGLAYKAIQFSGGELTQAQVEEFAEFFNTAVQPVFMFCRSGNRSSVIYQAAKQQALLNVG